MHSPATNTRFFASMKPSSKLSLLFLAVFAAASALISPKASAELGSPANIHDLKIGDAAPDFSLIGIDDKTHTLAEYKDAKVLMIAFISNHCPDSHATEERIKSLVEEMKGKSFAFVAINPNNPDGLSIDELGFSKYNDGFDDMKKYAAEQGFHFPYLYDGEKQETAKAYGCLATPHIFLFDADRKLRYKGQFDDSHYIDPSTVKSPDARNAVVALFAGKPVPKEVTQPHGCSTKWIERKKGIAEQTEKWDKTPVDVAQIDAAGIEALRHNGTNKLRLVNLWATWCGPCIAEFPELVKISRKYDMRDFEFISISGDDLKETAKVKAFLDKKGAGLSQRLQDSIKAEGRPSNSYIYKGGELEKALQKLDPEFSGIFPHSVLINPKGEIIWRQSGQINSDELNVKVLEYFGTVYKP